jgi:HEPN domain-containing protein
LDGHREGVARQGPGDLVIAEICADSSRAPSWAIGFHAQQTVEKVLKGRLLLDGVEPLRTHDARRLADQLAAHGLSCPLDRDALDALGAFAVSERYPSFSAPEAGRETVEPLLVLAQEAVAWLDGLVGG